jgi:cyclase
VVSVPVIASGGLGQPDHLVDAVHKGHADAIAIADILHYDRATIQDIKAEAEAAGIRVRRL